MGYFLLISYLLLNMVPSKHLISSEPKLYIEFHGILKENILIFVNFNFLDRFSKHWHQIEPVFENRSFCRIFLNLVPEWTSF